MPLKAGHHWPTSETPLNVVSLAGQWWANTECLLVSFVVLQGIQANIAKKPYIFVIFPLDSHMIAMSVFLCSTLKIMCIASDTSDFNTYQSQIFFKS